MAARIVEDETCVTCHDEATVILTLEDYLSFEGGGSIEAASCTEHLRESFEYLVTVETPRRRGGWPVTNTPHTAL